MAHARRRSSAYRLVFAWAAALALGSGCDTPETPDAGSDAGSACASDLECSDGVFCNGAEACAPDSESADARGCVVASAMPCAAGRCDETADACLVCDEDDDGHDAIGCGGDDCDDHDADRHPGNAERCDDADHDEDCDPSTFGYRNADGDAFVDAACCNVDGTARRCGDDCDDSAGGVNPEATEACDGIDNDCDGTADDGLSGAWWPDCDGDRYGRPSEAPVTTCAPPVTAPTVCGGAASARWADVDGDCDDENASRHPAASEECNAIDDDCDGALDGSGEDVDGDGVASLTCGGTDCDDARAEVRPGALEDCDGLDDDCDGAREDADGDAHLALGEACSGGALDALPRDDCDDSDAAVHPMAIELCNGTDDDCNTTVDDAPAADASCVAPSGSAACVAGACAIVSCPSGRDDCDGDYANGCEVDLASRDHCGACGNACGLACRAGACEVPIQIDEYAAHTCALLESGRVLCWGDGTNGQLGNGAFSEAVRPVYVSGLTDAVDVSAGGLHTCAVRMSGQAQCWGEGSTGQLGEGDFVFNGRSSPVDVIRGGGTVAIAAAYWHSCAVRDDGTVYCWGGNSDGQLGRAGWEPYGIVADVAGVAGATECATGFSGTCAVLGTGGVSCWGQRAYLGDGSTTRYTPAPVSGLTDAVAIDLSQGNFACALRSGGGARCWGENTSGQLGDGTFMFGATPVDVSGLSDAVAIDVGRDHACAVTSAGAVLCWGDNTSGQLGDGTRTRRVTPVIVPGIDDAVDVACGHRYTCAVRATGQIACWGLNTAGQLGDGTRTERLSPVRVEAP